ncbi:FkbM family methyltransferase [Leeuwenhoekiella nanhaiensis]|uniref:Methyltransferase FkbM domain-containing protein n=1 Tax=Leeuwenhoekiella nanhaiensis TaxID=1655491 RepID=A0A2G1VVN8_9FLAO|nr:FkbM family methyltransferase [Leeuwenhoekiella nanhaiensis]PHQ30519.1 hypothetical protein CJ305_06070 [Leeuwenhoekiella nanhaiensis]
MLKKLKYFIKRKKFEHRRKKFAPYTKGIIYNTENGIIAMSHEDMMIGKSLGRKGSWNSKEIDSLRKIVQPDDIIYFVGTHVGTLLIPIATHCKKVIGYEANPETFWFLKKNVVFNDLENVELFNLAVGDSKKKMCFIQNRMNTGGSKVKPIINDFRYKFDNPEEIEVDMIALDSHTKEFDLPAASGIVMDIEGAEYFALQGMKNTLESARFLYMEYVPHHLKNVSNIKNTELIDLVVPYFTIAVSQATGKEFGLTENRTDFISFLDYLDQNDKSDDFLFKKN